MSDGWIGHGTTVEYALTYDPAGVPPLADGVYDAELLQLRNVSGLDQTVEEVDISNFGSLPAPPSTVPPVREFINGFMDPGSLTMEGVYEYALFAAAAAARDLGTTHWRVTFPDLAVGAGTNTGTVFEFAGFVNNLSVNDQYDDAITLSVGLKLTGLVTVTAPTNTPP